MCMLRSMARRGHWTARHVTPSVSAQRWGQTTRNAETINGIIHQEIDMEAKDQDSKTGNESQPESGGGANPMMMGMGMMRKMMAQMGSGGEGPMAMMQKMMGQMRNQQAGEAPNPMQNMMSMCMGMQAEMLSALHTTTSMAAFATPELHALFATWMESLEGEALAALAQQGEVDTAALASQLKISEASAIHLVAQLATKGKVHLRAQASAAPAN